MFVRLCSGLNDRGNLVEESTVFNNIFSDKDYYQSLYYYNDAQYKEFQKTGSVKGVKDVVTNKLLFDIDFEGNLEKARTETIRLVSYLLGKNIKPEALEIYFSGNKGFHVLISFNIYFPPQEIKNIITTILKEIDLDIDLSVYDYAQILRLRCTKHPKSGLFKIPLTVDDLYDLSIDQIKETASSIEQFDDPREFSWETVNPKTLPGEWFDFTPEKPKKLEVTEDFKIDWSKKPKHWKNCKWAILQGKFKEKERHTALTILAATCRGLNYDKDLTYYTCKSALKKQAKFTGQDDFPKEELWKNIITDSVFGDGWEGGQYSCKTDPWLHKYCEALGDHKCRDRNEEPATIDFTDMGNKFLNYAENFDQNIIKTGLPALDDNATFLASTLVGILGQPGCHGKGTEILMYDGSIKLVEDIIVGDLLMGPDSEPREVLKLHRGKDLLYKIIPNKGEPFVINQHHILNIKPSIGTNNKAFECNLNITFKDYLEKTTKVVKNRYKIHRESVKFVTKEQEIPAYILGVWLGDGHSNGPILTNVDNEVINEWYGYADFLRQTVHVGPGNPVPTYRINGENNKFTKYLRDLNLIHNKHIPNKYLTGNTQQRLEILAGLLDTDGSLSHNGFDFISKYSHISRDVVYLSRSLGLAAYMSECQKGCMYKGEYREGTYYRVSISGNTDIIPNRIKRKQASPRKQVKDVLVTGFSYDILGEGDYYGFTLDKDHLYLTADFIVHHNSGKTSLALNYLRNTSLNNIPSLFFSLDMGLPIVFAKLVQKQTALPFKKVMELYRNDENSRVKINEIIKAEYKNVGFNFRSGQTCSDIKAHILDHQEAIGRPVKLVVVDYLENISGPYSDSVANTGLIANQLKDIANETGTCIVLLLQTQKHSTPNVSDPLLTLKGVKGSSVIEQSCSAILTLWREGYSPKTVEDDKFISFAIVKNRFGALWQDDFSWEGITGNIRSLTEEERSALHDLRAQKKLIKDQEDKGGGW